MLPYGVGSLAPLMYAIFCPGRKTGSWPTTPACEEIRKGYVHKSKLRIEE